VSLGENELTEARELVRAAPGLMASLGYRDRGWRLQYPDVEAINAIMDGRGGAVRFSDASGSVSNEHLARLWAAGLAPYARRLKESARGADVHYHDMGTHVPGYAVLPAALAKPSQAIARWGIESGALRSDVCWWPLQFANANEYLTATVVEFLRGKGTGTKELKSYIELTSSWINSARSSAVSALRIRMAHGAADARLERLLAAAPPEIGAGDREAGLAAIRALRTR
jgi:hypothetical protein